MSILNNPFMSLLFFILLINVSCSTSSGGLEEDSDTQDTADEDSNNNEDSESNSDSESDTNSDALDSDASQTDDDTNDFDALEVRACYPVWKSAVYPAKQVPFDQITHLILSFAIPKSNGSLDTSHITNLDELSSLAKDNNVKLVLSIGGGNGSGDFFEMAKDDAVRELFVENTVAYITENNLHGVKIDWEHWPAPETVDEQRSQALLNLVRDLNAAVQPLNVKMAVDVYASNWYGKHFPAEIINHVDRMNIMTIDAAGSWSEAGQHSSMDLVKSATTYWLGRIGQENRSKLTITIPFYGYTFLDGHQVGDPVSHAAYADIIKQYPNGIEEDEIKTETGTIYHNGRSTVLEKAQWVKTNGLAGTVTWELSFDSQDSETSLQKLLYKNR